MNKRSLLSLQEARIIQSDDESVLIDMDELTANRIRFWTGLGLAVSSSLFIGSSFIIKKIALRRLNNSGQLRAGSGGFGYLKEWIWWAGLLSMGLGEALNFSAYALVAASLVTPLGALSVLVSAVLASRYLDEKLNLLGRLGCFLCLIGSTVIVIHAPTEGEVDSLEQLGSMLMETEFMIYMALVIMSSFVLIFICAPKYGNSHILVYVMICSLIGSLSVMACKGLGLALRETFSGNSNQLSNGLFWLFLAAVIVSVTIQMNYLNKSLDVFDTSLVTPVYYVFFTSFVLIASSILYKEWSSMRYQEILGSLCGFFTVIIAIFLLHAFADFDISIETLRRHWIRQKTKNITKTVRFYDEERSSREQLIISSHAASAKTKKLTKKKGSQKMTGTGQINYSNNIDMMESDSDDMA